jgi:hypothetical protein
MKRFSMLVGALLTLVALSVNVPGCVHDDSSFYIYNVLAPPQGSTSGCVFTNDNTQPAFSEGYLDVMAVQAFNNNYIAEILVANQLIPMANQQLVVDETSTITIEGAVVTITESNGSELAYFTTPGSGTVLPSNGGNPGFTAVSFEIVDPGTVAKIRSDIPKLGDRETILTYIKAFGTTLGGDHEETNTFEFPIVACNGCLVQFDTDPTQEPQPNCYGPMPTTTSTETPCNFGNDVAFDCHKCSGGSAFCLCGLETGSCPTVVMPDAGAGGG